MAFTTKKIKSKVVGIIDIWTYKIRVAITKYKNKDLELIGYGEKRSLITEYESISETLDNKQTYEDIADGIKKAESDANTKIQEVIINIPFRELFFEFSKVNHIRKDHKKEIDEDELNEILTEVKGISLRKAFKNIKENNSYSKEQLKLIISNINNIFLDKKENRKLLWENPEEVNISILNIFIPEDKYDFIKSLWNTLEKKIIKIIPSEYSIAKLNYSKKNIVIIDLGSSHTSIIVKLDNNIIWVKKIAVWINDLIKEIQKNYNKTKIDIINSIDEGIYLKEKRSFLEIFKDVLMISLEEILWDKICPHHFFMLWWGSNKFIKQFLQEIDLNKWNLKIAKKISFLTPNIEYLSDIDSSKSNLNIYSMMNCALEFIKREKDPVEDSLKEIMWEF
jgi:hypothetical protein